MYLKHLSLQNFRSYTKAAFDFSKDTTLIVGPNTTGKSNIIEAIYLLATAESFRTEKDIEMMQFQKPFAFVEAKTNELTLKVIMSNGGARATKKYLVNNVPKRRVDFEGNLLAVIFSPLDLEIIINGPSYRRKFLDHVLEQADRDYRIAFASYTRAVRQRNALLDLVKETGRRNQEQFAYWDGLLIEHGNVITQKREGFLAYVNKSQKPIFDFTCAYDKSIISADRLLQYQNAEVGAGATLVGPHRDEVFFFLPNKHKGHEVKLYGSRGQQRLTLLQLKLLQMQFLDQRVGQRPMLLLDDIFSELDQEHIELVLSMLGKQQTIITTTHEEFVEKSLLKQMEVIELNG